MVVLAICTTSFGRNAMKPIFRTAYISNQIYITKGFTFHFIPEDFNQKSFRNGNTGFLPDYTYFYRKKKNDYFEYGAGINLLEVTALYGGKINLFRNIGIDIELNTVLIPLDFNKTGDTYALITPMVSYQWFTVGFRRAGNIYDPFTKEIELKFVDEIYPFVQINWSSKAGDRIYLEIQKEEFLHPKRNNKNFWFFAIAISKG